MAVAGAGDPDGAGKQKGHGREGNCGNCRVRHPDFGTGVGEGGIGFDRDCVRLASVDGVGQRH